MQVRALQKKQQDDKLATSSMNPADKFASNQSDISPGMNAATPQPKNSLI